MGAGVRAERGMGMERDVLLVIDVQNSFVPGGSLAVPRGEEIVPLINALARRFKHVVLTQDWHPPGHISFASSHPGTKPFEVIDLPYGKQVLWPDHCVQGTDGAKLHPELGIPHAQLIIRKGFQRLGKTCSRLESSVCVRKGSSRFEPVRGQQLTELLFLGARNGQSTLCAV